MFGDRYSSSTSCSRWLHETEPARLDQSRSYRFLKVATQPLDETLTVLGLGLSERLQRSLATTNAIESLLGRTRHVKRNVKRWVLPPSSVVTPLQALG